MKQRTSVSINPDTGLEYTSKRAEASARKVSRQMEKRKLEQGWWLALLAAWEQSAYKDDGILVQHDENTGESIITTTILGQTSVEVCQPVPLLRKPHVAPVYLDGIPDQLPIGATCRIKYGASDDYPSGKILTYCVVLSRSRPDAELSRMLRVLAINPA